MKLRISHIIILLNSLMVFALSEASAATQSFPDLVNAGDSLFQTGDYTGAILKYERARKLNSAHEKLNNNLISAYQQTENRAKVLMIEEIQSPRHLVTSPHLLNYFAIGSLILLIICGILMTRFFSSKRPPNKWFWLSFLAFLVLLTVSSFSILELNTHAIVTADEVPVSESTSGVSENISILNQGYKLEIIEAAGEWTLVELATGQTGWIKSDVLESI